jgi:hypothetical protein
MCRDSGPVHTQKRRLDSPFDFDTRQALPCAPNCKSATGASPLAASEQRSRAGGGHEAGTHQALSLCFGPNN